MQKKCNEIRTLNKRIELEALPYKFNDQAKYREIMARQDDHDTTPCRFVIEGAPALVINDL